MEWQEKVWKAGTPVEVFDVEMNLMGVGKLLKDYVPLPPDEDDDKLVSIEEALEEVCRCKKCGGSGKVPVGYSSEPLPGELCDECEGTGFVDFDIPEIEMEDGTVILGCDCFWMPVEETDKIKKEKSLADYVVNVRAEGYHGFTMNVRVTARNPDEATALACSKEPRFNEDDPYCLVVHLNENDEDTDDADVSVFCTYPTLAVALSHVKTITSGRWMLIEKDYKADSEGIVLRAWDDEEKEEYEQGNY
jgi:hypothetical protein